jgi:hypothetical protein
VKTARNSQRSKASNAVLLTLSHAVREVKSFRGLEAYNLVTGYYSYIMLHKSDSFIMTLGFLPTFANRAYFYTVCDGG